MLKQRVEQWSLALQPNCHNTTTPPSFSGHERQPMIGLRLYTCWRHTYEINDKFSFYAVTMLYCVISFRHNNHLVKVRKKLCFWLETLAFGVTDMAENDLNVALKNCPFFGWKLSQRCIRNICFRRHSHGWKMSKRLLKKIQWCHAHKRYNSSNLDSDLSLGSVLLFLPWRSVIM